MALLSFQKRAMLERLGRAWQTATVFAALGECSSKKANSGKLGLNLLFIVYRLSHLLSASFRVRVLP